MLAKLERLLSKSLTTLEVMAYYPVVHTGPEDASAATQTTATHLFLQIPRLDSAFTTHMRNDGTREVNQFPQISSYQSQRVTKDCGPNDVAAYWNHNSCLGMALGISSCVSVSSAQTLCYPSTITNHLPFMSFLFCPFYLLVDDCLDGLVVKASASRAEDPGFESHLRWDFFRVESYQ